MKTWLDKVIGPVFLHFLERIWNICSYGPVRDPNSRLKKESVFEEPELIPQVTIEI